MCPASHAWDMWKSSDIRVWKWEPRFKIPAAFAIDAVFVFSAVFSSSRPHTWPPSGRLYWVRSWHQIGASPMPWIADWETAICAAGWGRRLPAVLSVRQATLSRRSWTLFRVWLSQRYCELQVKQLHCPLRRDPLSQHLHLKQISPPRDNKGSSCLI